MVSAIPVPPSKSFIKPVIGGVTSPYGMRNGKLHAGVDYGAPYGYPVSASAAGRVTRAGWFGGYGIAVDVKHGNGYMTRYAHLSKTLVDVGDTVSQRQKIGLVGNTGDSTGPHLHFEIRRNGSPMNPIPFLTGSSNPDLGGSIPGIGGGVLTELANFVDTFTDPETYIRVFMIGVGVMFFIFGVIKVVKDNG